MSLSDKECNIIINKVDLNKFQTIGDLEIRGKETLAWEKGYFKKDVKEFIRKLKEMVKVELSDAPYDRLISYFKQIDKLAGKELLEEQKE